MQIFLKEASCELKNKNITLKCPGKQFQTQKL